MHQKQNDKTTCLRCGKCCRKGGPALHSQDMPLIQDGTIPLTHIVTIRPGERVFDQPAQEILPLAEEILKIKGRDGTWTCVFYSPAGQNCGMYDSRPAECEALFCRDIEPLAAMYEKDRLNRTDLLPAGHPLLELIAEHDKKCSLPEMDNLVKGARSGDAAAGEALKEMVAYDLEMRKLVPEKTGMPAETTDFLFGRPLKVLLRAFNVKVYEVQGGIRFDFAQGE